MRLGYACLNFHVKEAGFPKRTMQKKAFLSDKTLRKTSDIVLDNLRYIFEVCYWNMKHDMSVFRFSHFAPFMTEYEFTDLPDADRIFKIAARLGKLITDNDLRLTNHPGQFAVLCSPRDEVNVNTINELNKVAQIFDMMQLPATPHYKINIHIGGVYNQREATLGRFCTNFARLSPSAQARLTVENDDEQNGYTTQELVENVHRRIGIPIVFDDLHHKLNPGELSQRDALCLAASTWPDGVRPLIHHSDSKKEFEDPEADKKAHSEYIHTKVETFDQDVDVIFECKACENAVLKYREQFA